MANIVLLDGGLGQEIYKRSNRPAHPLWSAKVMMEQPDIVREVHRDFIEAGARIITVNNYTLTPSRLQRDGRPEWLQPMHRQALSIAKAAAAEKEGVQVAGCLPPLIGSYTTDERSYNSIKQEYDQLVALQAADVDLFIAETISSVRESVAAVRAAKTSGKPVLLSFSLSDERALTLRSGEPYPQHGKQQQPNNRTDSYSTVLSRKRLRRGLRTSKTRPVCPTAAMPMPSPR